MHIFDGFCIWIIKSPNMYLVNNRVWGYFDTTLLGKICFYTDLRRYNEPTSPPCGVYQPASHLLLVTFVHNWFGTKLRGLHQAKTPLNLMWNLHSLDFSVLSWSHRKCLRYDSVTNAGLLQMRIQMDEQIEICKLLMQAWTVKIHAPLGDSLLSQDSQYITAPLSLLKCVLWFDE